CPSLGRRSAARSGARARRRPTWLLRTNMDGRTVSVPERVSKTPFSAGPLALGVDERLDPVEATIAVGADRVEPGAAAGDTLLCAREVVANSLSALERGRGPLDKRVDARGIDLELGLGAQQRPRTRVAIDQIQTARIEPLLVKDDDHLVPLVLVQLLGLRRQLRVA